MFSPASILIGVFVLLSVTGHSQCTVSQDNQQRVITTCTFYAPNDGLFINRVDRVQAVSRVIYLGSEYLTYPIWQNGTLEMSGAPKAVPCRICFNLVTNDVQCQFAGDSGTYRVAPNAFTINGMRFVSQISQRSDKVERLYYRVLYGGKTKLLKLYRSRLSVRDNDVYKLDDSFNGTFVQQKTFYIQRDSELLRPVVLSRKSVLDVLDDPSGKLTQYLTKKKLTIDELTGAVAYYDGFR